MTIEEKRKKYDAECNKRDYCRDCPVGKDGSCLYPEYYTVEEEIFDEALAKFEADNKKSNPGQYEFDAVERPKHYASTSIECIDAMRETQGDEAVKHYCECNAFKYLWRHNEKNGDEDIRKASWYLNKAVEIIDKKEEEIREKFCPSPTVENFVKVLNKTKHEYIVKTNDEEGGST